MKAWHILIFITLLSMFALNSKGSTPFHSARHINLQIGISIDSAKKLLKSAGWVWDSLIKDNSEITRIRFLHLHLSHVDKPLAGVLRFQNGFLWSIGFGEVLTHNSSPTTKDYDQLVGWSKSIYGMPSDSGIRGATTYSEWVVPSNNGLKVYAVQFSSIGSLMFTGSYARNLFGFDSTKFRYH